MSKFDETREGFIEWQATRIKELESQLAERDKTIEVLKGYLNQYDENWEDYI